MSKRQSTLANNVKASGMILKYLQSYQKGVENPLTPFVGAKPKFLREPQIASKGETETVTKLASATIQQLILDAKDGVLVVLGQDASYCNNCRKMVTDAKDTEEAVNSSPVSVVLNNDWVHTIPHTSNLAVPSIGKRLVIVIGTPGKYLSMCMHSKLQSELTEAFTENRLVVVTKGSILLPLGLQEQNLFGTHAEQVVVDILSAVDARGGAAWGYGIGTKKELLSNAFHHLPHTMHWMHLTQATAAPTLMTSSFEEASSKHDQEDEFSEFDSFVQYVKYSNELKLSMPTLNVVNYYDTGLLVSVVQGFVVDSGVSLLTDRDGLAMLRDASIGHTMSKMHQITNVEPCASARGVYNFYIGDGAARLNCGMETAFHLMENYSGGSFVTLFVFNNHKWAIEDNLVAETEEQHILYNTEYYDTLAQHPNVTMTNSAEELHKTLASTVEQQHAYAQGNAPAKFQIIVIRGLDLEVPLLLGDMDSIRQSSEMALMQKTLGKFASSCEAKVPLYGCSAFEYIQYLKTFMDDTPEGKLYQYNCGRTDIQAAHMCGFDQPEGKCVLFINDVYGINSLGESLRMIQSGIGSGKQVLVFIWHPSLLGAIDHFHLHRPPMVWPTIGTTLAKFYVRKEADALFVDFHGHDVEATSQKISEAVEADTPLVLINMLPEHEQNYVALDMRAKIPKKKV